MDLVDPDLVAVEVTSTFGPYIKYYLDADADESRALGCADHKLKLEHYVQALQDPTSGVTYPALTGSRKQSVVDAECLFNPDLEKFMLGPPLWV